MSLILTEPVMTGSTATTPCMFSIRPLALNKTLSLTTVEKSSQLPHQASSHRASSLLRPHALPVPTEQPRAVERRQDRLLASRRLFEWSVPLISPLSFRRDADIDEPCLFFPRAGWPKGYLVDVFATRSACRASLASGGNDSACSVGLKNTDINAAAACEQTLSSSLVVNEQTGVVGTVDRPPGCTPEEKLVGINPLCSSPDFRKLPVPDLVTPVDHARPSSSSSSWPTANLSDALPSL